jgi:hypothetical protein
MLPSWWSDDSTLIVIDIGIDESKSPPSPLLVLSAIVGNTGSMRKLDKEWKRDLSASGVDYFHAKDHWNFQAAPYHDIGRIERQKLLERLVSHTQHRFRFGVSAMVDEAEYRANASQRFQSQQGSPYAFAFQILMVLVSIELSRQRRFNQPINILIEDGHNNAMQVIELIEAKKKRGGGLTVATHGLGGKKDNPILQSADLLAYSVSEYYSKGQSDFLSRLAPPELSKRFINIPWSASSVEALKSDIVWYGDLLKAGIPGAKRRQDLVMW